MRTVAIIGCAGLALVLGGCSSSESSPMSKVVTTDSAEYRQGKAAQDEYERQAKEAERKALGGQQIDN